MNFWFDAQKNLMNSWFNMGPSSPAFNPFLNGHYHTNGGGQNPWTTFPMGAWWNAVTEAQMKQMQKFWSGDDWMTANWFDPNMAESARLTAEKMLNSQKVVLQMFESMAESWTAAVQTDDLAKWQADLAKQMQEQTAQMRSQWDAASAQANELAESSSQMWLTYLEQLQQTGMPWLGAWMMSSEQAGTWVRNWSVGEADPTNLMGYFWKAYDETFGKIASSPPLGLTRQLNLELTKGFETWLTYRRADTEYQRLVSRGWLQFMDAFGKRLAQMAQEGKLIESPRQFIDLWVEVGDEEFTKLFQGESYAKVQGNLVNSSMAFKRQQRLLLEIWLRANDMPTRSDVDEAHRTVHELRKDVKALQKEVRNLQKALINAVDSASGGQATAGTQKPAAVAKPPAKSSGAKATSRSKTTTAAKTRTARKSGANVSTQAGR